MTDLQVKVPELGERSHVPVIEILVAPGDLVTQGQSIMTLESEKATLDIPSSHAGTVIAIHVGVGDSVSSGDVIMTVRLAQENSATQSQSAPTSETAAKSSMEKDASQKVSVPSSTTDVTCGLLVIGGGPGGYTAAFRAADLGCDVVLVDRSPTLGGVCLNVGCIPSKALLHAAEVIDSATHASTFGVHFGEMHIDVPVLREYTQSVVRQLTSGLAQMAKKRKVRVITGEVTFIGQNQVRVVCSDGVTHGVGFAHCIVAAGSHPVRLPIFPSEDPRVIDSTGALALSDIPRSLLVVGGGIIGLEMATVYARLGSRVVVVEFQNQLIPGADRDLVQPLMARLQSCGVEVHLETKASQAKAQSGGILVSFESATKGATVGLSPTEFARVLVAVGRAPNGKQLGLEAAGVSVTPQGFVPVDQQMRTNVSHIFAIGDIVGNPMLAHKATHEGKLAAEVVAGHNKTWVSRVIPSVAYTDPEIAWVGATESEAQAKGIAFTAAKFPWSASGRAIGIHRTEGFTKLLFDPKSNRVIGGAVVGPHAGELIAEIALAVEMGADVADITHTIHPHPTLSESVAMAAEIYEGTITDLYMPRKST